MFSISLTVIKNRQTDGAATISPLDLVLVSIFFIANLLKTKFKGATDETAYYLRYLGDVIIISNIQKYSKHMLKIFNMAHIQFTIKNSDKSCFFEILVRNMED